MTIPEPERPVTGLWVKWVNEVGWITIIRKPDLSATPVSNRSVNKLTRRFDLPVPTVAAQHAVQKTELQRKLAKSL